MTDSCRKHSMGKSNQNSHFSEAIHFNKNYIAKELSLGLLIFKLIFILPDSVCTSFIFWSKIRIHFRRKHFESLKWVNILAESAHEKFSSWIFLIHWGKYQKCASTQSHNVCNVKFAYPQGLHKSLLRVRSLWMLLQVLREFPPFAQSLLSVLIPGSSKPLC